MWYITPKEQILVLRVLIFVLQDQLRKVIKNGGKIYAFNYLLKYFQRPWLCSDSRREGKRLPQDSSKKITPTPTNKDKLSESTSFMGFYLVGLLLVIWIGVQLKAIGEYSQRIYLCSVGVIYQLYIFCQFHSKFDISYCRSPPTSNIPLLWEYSQKSGIVLKGVIPNC